MKLITLLEEDKKDKLLNLFIKRLFDITFKITFNIFEDSEDNYSEFWGSETIEEKITAIRIQKSLMQKYDFAIKVVFPSLESKKSMDWSRFSYEAEREDVLNVFNRIQQVGRHYGLEIFVLFFTDNSIESDLKRKKPGRYIKANGEEVTI